MRLAILALLPVFLFACQKSDDTPCDTTCKATKAKYNLDDHNVRAADSLTFTDEDGLAYTLVRIEYGDTEECDEFGEDCGYSTYCAWVVDGQDYPISYNFVTDADVLFDEDEYCDDLGCDLPGDDLAINDDDEFDDWLWDTDEEDNILVTCFDD